MDNIAPGIENIPLFAGCDKRALARLVPKTRIRKIPAGTVLFADGAAAKELFYITSGKVRLMSGKRLVEEVGHGFIGEEAVLNSDSYLHTAYVEEEAVVTEFAEDGMQALVAANPAIKERILQSYIRHSPRRQPVAEGGEDCQAKATTGSISEVVGWLLAILLPAALYTFAGDSGLSVGALYFFMIFSAAGVMWVFRLLPEYVPAIFIVMSVLVLGLVPTNVILSGYSSGSFFMALSVFGLGGVLVQSGLTYRLALIILRYTPATISAMRWRCLSSASS